MNLFDYIIIGLLAAAVTGIIIRLIRRKKHGGSCCGCGNCPQKNNCGNKSC